jgi:hypothetical protein
MAGAFASRASAAISVSGAIAPAAGAPSPWVKGSKAQTASRLSRAKNLNFMAHPPQMKAKHGDSPGCVLAEDL